MNKNVQPGDEVEITFNANSGVGTGSMRQAATGTVMQAFVYPYDTFEYGKIWTHERAADGLGFVVQVRYGSDVPEAVHKSKSRVEVDDLMQWLSISPLSTAAISCSYERLSSPQNAGLDVQVNP